MRLEHHLVGGYVRYISPYIIIIIIINDLLDALQSQVALYADDSTTFCSSLGRRDGSRTELCSMPGRDLAQILAWGQDCIGTFNDRKTKPISVSRSKDRNFPAVHMGPQVLAYSEDLRILGMDITSDLSWGKYISGIAKSAAMRVGCLSRARKFTPLSALLYLYKTSIRPLIAYCSHIWAGAPDCYLGMLDKVQRTLERTWLCLLTLLVTVEQLVLPVCFTDICLWTLLLRYFQACSAF